MRVLITGLFEPAALHAIRRFGEMGYEVVAADCHRMAFSGFSKYVSRRIRLPYMRHDPKRYAERLLQEIETGGYDCYFPAFEEIILMSHYRDRVLAAVKSTIPETRTLLRLHDKVQLAQLATELGIDTPSIFVPQSSEEARSYIAKVDHPVVIKMRQTSGAAGFRKVYEPSQLERLYFDVVRVNGLSEANLPMIQRLVEGPTTCTLELCHHGEVIGDVMYQGIRTMPRTGGTTVFRESVADPACREAASQIVRKLEYDGFCGFDFIIDRETGRPVLVDGNCRTTPAVSMAYHGGCDMIEGWIGIAAGDPVARLPESRIGVRTKIQFGDFVWLLESYLGSFKDWSGERRLRRQWWHDKDFHYDITSLRDPMPIVMIWAYIFTNLYKLVFTNFDSAQLFLFHNMYVEDPKPLAAAAPVIGPSGPGHPAVAASQPLPQPANRRPDPTARR